jgi:hypothetical protein
MAVRRARSLPRGPYRAGTRLKDFLRRPLGPEGQAVQAVLVDLRDRLHRLGLQVRDRLCRPCLPSRRVRRPGQPGQVVPQNILRATERQQSRLLWAAFSYLTPSSLLRLLQHGSLAENVGAIGPAALLTPAIEFLLGRINTRYAKTATSIRNLLWINCSQHRPGGYNFSV